MYSKCKKRAVGKIRYGDDVFYLCGDHIVVAERELKKVAGWLFIPFKVTFFKGVMKNESGRKHRKTHRKMLRVR